MTRSAFSPPPDAATEEHAALLAFVKKAAEIAGAFTIYAGEPGFTPFRVSFTTRERPWPAPVGFDARVLRSLRPC